MKVSSALIALSASLPFSSAFFRNGFNIAANKEDGSCKVEKDWYHNFRTMKSLPGRFSQARVYASSDCATLREAIPAAKRAGVKLLAGVWTEDAGHYAAEKAAFEAALRHHGTSWLSSVSVGSEDLYRNDTTPGALAGQVREIRGILSRHKGGKAIPVGHVDTYTEWIKRGAKPLIHAVDFIGMDAYPYYQGAKIQRAHGVFYKALGKTKRAAGHKPVWVTESGWPVTGPSDKKAHPSAKNAEHYWHTTMCKLFKTHNTFAYTLRDYWITPNLGEPSFGVIGSNGKPIFRLKC